ncbi:MAG: ABC transporter permease [Lachnospiraceae bacterium]|nr:ABC transporter permease [Lachnospiraceae bacterium]
MERNGMQGLRTIFQFSWKQTIKTKGFILSTLGIGILLLAGIMVVYGLIAHFSSKDEPSPVKHIYIINESDLKEFSPEYYHMQASEEFSEVEVSMVAKEKEAYFEEVMAKPEEYTEAIILLLSQEEEEYKFTAITVEETALSDSEVLDAVEPLEQSVFMGKLTHSGITPKQLAVLSTPISYETKDAGEESKSFGIILMSMVLPMIFSFVIYMMVLLYGQSISKSVIAEKNSKIIETLLTSTRPYAIIFGKVLAQVLAAVTQIFIWVLCIGLGIVFGHYLALAINPEFKDGLFEVVKMLKDQNLASAFSPVAIIIALIYAIVGFVFYCSIASLIGANVSKMEDLGSAMSVYQVPVMIGFFVSYFIPLSGANETLLQVVRYVPVTSAFMTPVDILLGNMSLLGGILSLVIILAVTIVFLVLAGRCYKNKIFYNGKPFFFMKSK